MYVTVGICIQVPVTGAITANFTLVVSQKGNNRKLLVAGIGVQTGSKFRNNLYLLNFKMDLLPCKFSNGTWFQYPYKVYVMLFGKGGIFHQVIFRDKFPCGTQREAANNTGINTVL